MKTILLTILITLGTIGLHAQDTLLPVYTDTVPFIPGDSLNKVAEPLNNPDQVEAIIKYHSPRKAAIRSAILPGLGQIYNKKYWKVPIVYAALGTSAAIFNYNLQWYRRTRFAYKTLVNKDTANFVKVHNDLQVFIIRNDQNALKSHRDEFRSNIDYSVLFFILLWGLNVVDATVDAHLKSFDVSPDLGFKFKLGPSQMAGTTGLSLVLAFK